MVERQPRHNGDVRRGHPAVERKVVGHDLLEIGEDIFVRDHDTSRRPGGPRCVLQIHEIRPTITRAVRPWPGRSLPSVEIQQINFDDRRSRSTLLRLYTFVDSVNDSGRREDDTGRRIGQHRNSAFIVDAAMWHRKRHRDQSGLQGAQEADDIFDSLRCQQ